MGERLERFMIPLDRRWNAWREVTGEQQHANRFPLMRLVRVELSESLHGDGDEAIERVEQAGLTINIGSGGLCLLLDWAPEMLEVLRLHLPMAGTLLQTPTLAEVRWARPLPFGWNGGVYAVGLKFVL